MDYVRARGYPVPKVEEVSADGTKLIMERIDGANMVDALTATPWKARRFGRVLADLHRQLHEMASPEWLAPAPFGRGDRLLHMDLHPLNVMMSSRGPVVIDWVNAARGDPNTDVALTWALLSAGEVPTNGVKGALVGVIRSRFIRGFIGTYDAAAIAEEVDAVVEWKSKDPNLSESEVEAARDFARRVRPS